MYGCRYNFAFDDMDIVGYPIEIVKGVSMFKGFKQIVSFTMLSRLLGMVRDVCYSRFFGATALGDAWIIAFRIPNLSRRIFGEGAAVSSFIPVYSSELEKDPETAKRLANTVTTVIFTFLSAVVVVGWLILWYFGSSANVTADMEIITKLTAIMLPYAAVICTVAIMSGILNVHGHFAAPAAAPVILNCFIIAAIVITGYVLGLPSRMQVFVAAVSVLLAGAVQTAVQMVVLKRLGVMLRPAWDVHLDASKKVPTVITPMILGANVTQINTLSDEIIAWMFSGSDDKGTTFTILGNIIQYPLWRGSVMHLYLSQRLYQLPLGVFGISLATAIFPVLSKAYAQGDNDKMNSSLTHGLKMAFYIALPCSMGLIVIANPLIRILFENGSQFSAGDTSKCAMVLYAYGLGITGFFFQQILVKAFYAAHDSKLPAKTAMWAVGINIVLNLILIWMLGAAGLALATTICSYFQVGIMIAVLRKKFGYFTDKFAAFTTKTIIASIGMLAAGLTTTQMLRTLPTGILTDSIRIGLAMAVCVAVYAGISKLSKNEGLNMILRRK